MDNQYKNNAKEAISIFKAEITSEIAYNISIKYSYTGQF